jgi:hypothetical protein
MSANKAERKEDANVNHVPNTAQQNQPPTITTTGIHSNDKAAQNVSAESEKPSSIPTRRRSKSLSSLQQFQINYNQQQQQLQQQQQTQNSQQQQQDQAKQNPAERTASPPRTRVIMRERTGAHAPPLNIQAATQSQQQQQPLHSQAPLSPKSRQQPPPTSTPSLSPRATQERPRRLVIFLKFVKTCLSGVAENVALVNVSDVFGDNEQTLREIGMSLKRLQESKSGMKKLCEQDRVLEEEFQQLIQPVDIIESHCLLFLKLCLVGQDSSLSEVEVEFESTRNKIKNGIAKFNSSF